MFIGSILFTAYGHVKLAGSAVPLVYSEMVIREFYTCQRESIPCKRKVIWYKFALHLNSVRLDGKNISILATKYFCIIYA